MVKMTMILQASLICALVVLRSTCHHAEAFLPSALSTRRQNEFRLEVETSFSREQIFQQTDNDLVRRTPITTDAPLAASVMEPVPTRDDASSSYTGLTGPTKAFAWLGVAISGALIAASPSIALVDVLSSTEVLSSQVVSASSLLMQPVISNSVSFMTEHLNIMPFQAPVADMSELNLFLSNVMSNAHAHSVQVPDAIADVARHFETKAFDLNTLQDWKQFVTLSESAKNYHAQHLALLPSSLQHPHETMQQWTFDMEHKLDQVRAFVPKSQAIWKDTVSTLMNKVQHVQYAATQTLDSLSSKLQSDGQAVETGVASIRTTLEHQQADFPARREEFQSALGKTQESISSQFTLLSQKVAQQLENSGKEAKVAMQEMQTYSKQFPTYVDNARSNLEDLSLMAQSMQSQVKQSIDTASNLDPSVAMKEYVASAQSLTSQLQLQLGQKLGDASSDVSSTVSNSLMKPRELQLLSLDEMKEYVADKTASISVPRPPISTTVTASTTSTAASSSVVEPASSTTIAESMSSPMASFKPSTTPTAFVSSSYQGTAFVPEKVHAATHISPVRFDVSAQKDLSADQVNRLESLLLK